MIVATIRYGLDMEAFDALRALLPDVNVVAGQRKIQLHFTKLKELHQFVARIQNDEDHNVDPHTWHYVVTLEAQDDGPSRLRHHVHIPPKEIAAVVAALRSTAA